MMCDFEKMGCFIRRKYRYEGSSEKTVDIPLCVASQIAESAKAQKFLQCQRHIQHRLPERSRSTPDLGVFRVSTKRSTMNPKLVARKTKLQPLVVINRQLENEFQKLLLNFRRCKYIETPTKKSNDFADGGYLRLLLDAPVLREASDTRLQTRASCGSTARTVVVVEGVSQVWRE